MSQVSAYKPGQFSWVDLLSPSADTSKKFYSELLGWSALDQPTDEGGAYTQFQYKGALISTTRPIWVIP